MYDCLIIGGGLAGWMAAREIVRAGLRPLMLSDGQGASPWVHGFNVPVRKGDSAEAFWKDTQKSGQGLSDPKLAAALCNDASVVFAQLRDMGLLFNREGEEVQALRPLGASYPRVVSIGNETGAAVLQKLREALDVRELRGARAVRLLTRGGQVCGALAYDQPNDAWLTLPARATVLACGGFCGIYPMSTNKRDSGGDGIAMAYEAGAKLCDMEFIQFEPSGAVHPKELIGTSMITTLFFEGAVLRNREGERFMLRYGSDGERVGKDVLARLIAAEIASGHGTAHGGVYMDMTAVGRARLERDYAMYVERYRRVGIDICEEAIEIAPMPHTSLGGVCIGDDGRTTVDGLFACGEIVGGLHGANRIGGSAGLETLVFGRRAGQSAARYAANAPETSCEPELPICGGASIAERLAALREDMQSALWKGVNVIRKADSLQKAIDVFQAGLRELDGLKGAHAREVYQRLRTKNDMTTALLVAQAALAREDSLGCHVRADASAASEPPYRVTLSKQCNDEAVIGKEFLNG